MNKALILLSGGLDSLVSLGLARNDYNVELALTFDYGQKSANQEIEASKKICEFYGIKHQIIKLDWLKNITQTALVSDIKVPDVEKSTEETAKAVWVPNRNGLFLNIAGCFADSFSFSHIIIGANKQEGQTFPDNTQSFIDRINAEFEFSTQAKPKVVAPLINFDKNDIVKHALNANIPLELTRSCYNDSEKNCGTCESCKNLKNALLASGGEEYIGVLF